MSEIADQDQTMAQEEQIAHPVSSTAQSVSAASTDVGDSPVRDDAAIIKAGLAAVAEWEAENGAFTDEELAWADEVLDRAERHYENLKHR